MEATGDDNLSPALRITHILETVFQNLNVEDRGKVALVCREWEVATRHSSLWKDAVLKLTWGRPISMAFIQERKVTKFKIVDGEYRCWGDLFTLTASVVEPRRFDFAGCWQLTDAMFQQAFQRQLPAVTTLILSDCGQLSDDSVEVLSSNMTNLERLNLADCNRITDDACRTICINLPRLNHLDLSGCMQITQQGIAYLVDGTYFGDVTRHPRIAYLRLSGCERIRDNALRRLSRMTALRELDISQCRKFKDAGLIQLATNNNLRVLNLSGCPGAYVEGLPAVSRMAGLRVLKLRGCRNASYLALVYMYNRTRIACLDISGCRLMRDNALELIASRMSNLQALWLDNTHVTDRGLHFARQFLGRLQRLNIRQQDGSWRTDNFDRN